MSSFRSASVLSADQQTATSFQRLNALLHGVKPGQDPIVLTVGEPRHALPDFTGPVLMENLDDFRRYPAMQGTEAFREAVAGWLGRRYNLATGADGNPIDPARHILPLNGSREGLFFAALSARTFLGKTDPDPVILLPNPYYHTYSAGAEAAGARAVYMDATADNGFLPDLDALDPAVLDRAIALYLASPANPQGSVASLDYWTRLIGLSRKHRFFIFADECYSEIYRDTPPPGVLEAAQILTRPGDGIDLSGILTFNSLSKRSNMAGLRCGFAVGDPEFMANWLTFRNRAAPQVPMPVQAVAVAALSDETHVIENRRLYNAKFASAERHLGSLTGFTAPAGGFFVWLDVGRWGGGVRVTEKLWAEAGVKVVPGGYLAQDADDGGNPGAAYIRIAMVESLDITERAMQRIAAALRGWT
ncbi:aminotransferase class I/II-fold pyridoxal phosphate-dependent enzyme [Breoghania sp. L-A4]|uniref:aminotransferase class I/II-fold pyridoxal phosphate-dependent enzyme n=1 Tax=Breoghania sp. L-A4 TaxID=2304600 RepID=UPI000E35980A|nr:aminotransferase class I/II-fold pyridoxal phosphate-dependent enzyme [Breoghania sp. L-A4]AXS42321.1 aminotransferase class I/II-fold pyridoxal phosphate-dependent enzyme [Breoghania sp. L-A4]